MNIKQKIDNYLYSHDFTPKELVGIYFGENEIQVSEIKKAKNGEFKLFVLDYLPLENNESIYHDEEIYIEKIKDIFKRNKIKNRNVAISIPKNEVVIKHLNIHRMETKDMVDTFSYNQFWENLVQLDEKIDKYFIFYQILKDDEKNKKMDIIFTALKYEQIDIYKNICEACGLTLLNISVENSSEANLVNYLRRNILSFSKSNFYGILKISENNTYFSIVNEDKVYTVDVFISHNEMQELKSFVKPDIKNLNRTLDRISLQIRQIINEFELKYDLKQDTIKEIYTICPFLHGEYYSSMLKQKNGSIKIEFVNPYNKMILDTKVEGFIKDKNSSFYTTVLGDSLNVFRYFYFSNNKNKKFFNLFPFKGKYIKKFKNIFYINTTLLFFIIVSFFTLFILYSNSFSKAYKINQEIATYIGVEEKLSEIQNKYKKIKLEKEIIELKMITKNKFIDNKEEIYKMLDGIYNSIQEELWLNDLNYDFIKRNIIIEGKSFSDTAVLDFLNKLKTYNSLVEKVNLENILIENQSNVLNNNEKIKRFKISIKLNDNIELKPLEKDKK